MTNWESLISKIAKGIYESLEQPLPTSNDKQNSTTEEYSTSTEFVVAFVANKEGDARVCIDWPAGLDPEYIANIMTKMLVLLSNGNVQQAIVGAIEKKGIIDKNQELAEEIVNRWLGELETLQKNGGEDENGIVVDPTQVFSDIVEENKNDIN